MSNDAERPSPPPLLGVGNPVPRARWVWLAPALVVLTLVTAVGAFVVATRMRDAVAGPKQVGRYFLQAVVDGDLRTSYGLLCEARRDFTNSIEFREEMLDGRPAATRALRGVARETGDSKERRITYSSAGRPADPPVVLELVREPERWAVCTFSTGVRRGEEARDAG